MALENKTLQPVHFVQSSRIPRAKFKFIIAVPEVVRVKVKNAQPAVLPKCLVEAEMLKL